MIFSHKETGYKPMTCLMHHACSYLFADKYRYCSGYILAHEYTRIGIYKLRHQNIRHDCGHGEKREKLDFLRDNNIVSVSIFTSMYLLYSNYVVNYMSDLKVLLGMIRYDVADPQICPFRYGSVI